MRRAPRRACAVAASSTTRRRACQASPTSAARSRPRALRAGPAAAQPRGEAPLANGAPERFRQRGDYGGASRGRPAALRHNSSITPHVARSRPAPARRTVEHQRRPRRSRRAARCEHGALARIVEPDVGVEIERIGDRARARRGSRAAAAARADGNGGNSSPRWRAASAVIAMSPPDAPITRTRRPAAGRRL